MDGELTIPLGHSGEIVVITTKNASDGVSGADAAPTLDIYGDIGDGPILTGLSMTSLTTGVYYRHQIVLGASGFAAGKTYTVLADFDMAGTGRKKAYNLRVT